MELRLGSRVFGIGDFVIWLTGPGHTPPTAGHALPARTGIVEVPADPERVARAREETGLPLAVAVPDPKGPLAAECAAGCAAAGAEVFIGDQAARLAVSSGAALLCTDPGQALRAGVRDDGIIIDAGLVPAAAVVERLVATGRPVLVTLAAPAPEPTTAPTSASASMPVPTPHDEAAGGSAVPDPGLLATASVYAWLGVRIFRTRPQDAHAVGQVLDMVASIQGTRPPTLTRRGLA